MEQSILELRNSLDKSSIEDAEKMLRSFYRTIEPHYRRNWIDPERISWEIYAEKDKIGFYVIVPKRLERLIKSRMTDAYPQVSVIAIENDHVNNFQNPYTAKMELNKHFMFSTNMNASDTTLNSILNSMSRLDTDDKMLLQISLLPINDTWQGVAYRKYRDMLFRGKKPKPFRTKSLLTTGFAYSIKAIFSVFEEILSTFVDVSSNHENKNTPIERNELKETQKKISLPAFNVSIRMAAESKDRNIMSTRLLELTNSFIETDGDNEWRRIVKINNKKILDEIINRKVDRYTNNKATTAELSPLIRMANKNINVPELTRKLIKTLPIPKGLEKGVYFGKGLHDSEEFDLFNNTEHVDSFVHPWMVTGAMGGGKTTLINNMMLARALAGYGVIILDTQGDMSRDFLSQIPKSEQDRVVWLNYGDLDYPVALDMLETVPVADPRHQKFVMQFAKNELITLFKKMFGQNFGPQTEYIVRHIVTATMQAGQSSFIEMFRMLVDDEYREEIASKIKFKAPFSWSFWRNFQDNFSLPQKMRMVMPSINKIGSFVEDPMIMNITSQGLGSQNYSFRKMMDEGKIVVATIPKGKLIGTWQLIGSLVLGKIWTAALSRENIPIEKRKPCFLAIDEAEDLVDGNENFSIMLSQARKFRLGPVFGFQYLDQVKSANRAVYNALIGNKPNIVALKIGEKDAEVYEDIFKGYYNKEEMNFPDLHGIAKLNIDGTYSTPFTLKIPYNFFNRDNSDRVIDENTLSTIQENSRKLYAKPIDEVESIVNEKYASVIKNLELFEEAEEIGDLVVSEEFMEQLRKI
jgi:hypothetical protein